MTDEQLLSRHGLFSSNAPRYTSYPPANQFKSDVGRRHAANWMETLPPDQPVSLYIHIPFCRRLCWFCACRTQGTRTLSPLESYVDTLCDEIDAVAARLPRGAAASRLHLGGGTPTLLPPDMMGRLLDRIAGRFDRAEGYEFSAEIDPTEAPAEIIDLLIARGMKRASIGVQDFAPAVQEAIGREQSFEETRLAADRLRAGGVESLNLDLLYGLPHQTEETLSATLELVNKLRPGRIALYGYAHVPWMSKRQALIDDDALPGARGRFAMSELARRALTAAGYQSIGIDHFALPEDSLAVAARAGRVRRNFQGYTDDPATTLIGLGASAISKYEQGYAQNAVATAAWAQRVQTEGIALDRGYVLTARDRLTAAMIESLMCRARIDIREITALFPEAAAEIGARLKELKRRFTDAVVLDEAGAAVPASCRPLLRILAAHLDQVSAGETGFSKAI